MYLHNPAPLDYFVASNNYVCYYIKRNRLRKLCNFSVFLPETKHFSYNSKTNKKNSTKNHQQVNKLLTYNLNVLTRLEESRFWRKFGHFWQYLCMNLRDNLFIFLKLCLHHLLHLFIKNHVQRVAGVSA